MKHIAKEQALYGPVGIPVVDFAEPFDDDNAVQITNLGTRQSKLNLTWRHLKQKVE